MMLIPYPYFEQKTLIPSHLNLDQILITRMVGQSGPIYLSIYILTLPFAVDRR